MADNRRIQRIESDIATIKENHLAHIEVDLSRVQTNVDWLMRYHWIVATASIGALITGILTLVK